MQLTCDEYRQCEEHAAYLIEKGYYKGTLDATHIIELLVKNFIEKKEREALLESTLDYNDEIVSIEYVGECETVDIGVSGDNLFLCNGILTKNSMGLVHTLDLYLAQMAPEELQDINQMMFKQLKNRYNDLNTMRKFVVGFDRPRMTFYNLESSAQSNIDKGSSKTKTKSTKEDDDKPLFDKSTFGRRSANSFNDFNFK